MAEWFFEPGHTAAEFSARHMMVTYVRGHFKNIHGKLIFDPARPGESRVGVQIDAKSLWTGEPDRDAHLRSADFLDVEHYPAITRPPDSVRGSWLRSMCDDLAGEFLKSGLPTRRLDPRFFPAPEKDQLIQPAPAG